MKWGNTKSRLFDIRNGTRQGSSLSPILFSVYIDNMIVGLRNQGIGCHIAGQFYGLLAYADDLILLAPSRSALQYMVKYCSDYSSKHNLNLVQMKFHQNRKQNVYTCVENWKHYTRYIAKTIEIEWKVSTMGFPCYTSWP